MLALVYYGNRDIRLEERPVPDLGKGQVLLRVTDAGLCQTQVNELMEGPYIINSKPNPLTNRALPLIVGHEFGGKVVEVGEGVDPRIAGEQVAVLPLLSCGSCEWCNSGREHLCDSLAYYGLTGADGGFAEYAVVQSSNILPIGDRQLLTFVEPLLVASHACAKLEKEVMEGRMLILGAGAIGVATATVLKDLHDADVSLSDMLPGRAERAVRAGFRVLDKTELSRDYDAVFDCAGNDHYAGMSPAFVEGLGYLRKQGSLVCIGSYFHPLSFEPIAALLSENRIIHSFGHDSRDVKRLAAELSRIRTDLGVFIEEIDLPNIVEDGYYRAEVDKNSFTRLVIRC